MFATPNRFAACLLGLLSVSRVSATNYNVTAIAGVDGESVFQCWSMGSPLNVTNGNAQYSLDISDVTLALRTPGDDIGAHVAPYPQWVFILTGKEVFSLPQNNETVILDGDEYSVIFAADTANVSTSGHSTTTYGPGEVISLELQTKDEQIPEHTVIHAGPCNTSDFQGQRNIALGDL